jgi:hypothetical protein
MSEDIHMDTAMESKVRTLENKVIGLEIRVAVAESNIKEMKEKLGKIDSNTSWTVRLVIGAILLSIINVVLNGGA